MTIWISGVQENVGAWLAPRAVLPEEVAKFLHAQQTALQAVRAVGKELRPGWTEKQAAMLLDCYLRDVGVERFFHHSFAWFGERTAFQGIGSYQAFGPSQRVLQQDEVFILDTAPIVSGYICDIGYTDVCGVVPEFSEVKEFLWELREQIPGWALQAKTGAELWNRVESAVVERGWVSAHRKYPFEVLGHRVHSISSPVQRAVMNALGGYKILNFGLSSYFELSIRLLVDQLLTPKHQKPLRGLWAIEPHVGLASFGAKFEEILYICDTHAEWISTKENACLPAN